jgi:hypothetical protein
LFHEWQHSEEATQQQVGGGTLLSSYYTEEEEEEVVVTVVADEVGVDIHGESTVSQSAAARGANELDEHGHERMMSTENPMVAKRVPSEETMVGGGAIKL